MVKTEEFASENYLDSEEDIIEFLNAALDEVTDMDEDDALGYFFSALGVAARAKKKMSDISRRAGGSRTNLYKSFTPTSNPSFRTVADAISELGGSLAIVPKRVEKISC